MVSKLSPLTTAQNFHNSPKKGTVQQSTMIKLPKQSQISFLKSTSNGISDTINLSLTETKFQDSQETCSFMSFTNKIHSEEITFHLLPFLAFQKREGKLSCTK